mgnify:CR=1 FL=1
MMTQAPDTEAPDNLRPAGVDATVIVLGNEKGGTGKSTTAMHVTVGLPVSLYTSDAADE